jgi:phage portal protein BeeE
MGTRHYETMALQPQFMTGADSQHLETRKFQIGEICRAFGVPAKLLAAREIPESDKE